jgi:hypothetical protein
VGLKTESGQESPTFAVRFPPVWNHVAQVASYLNTLLEVKGRADGADRVGIVVHELLENAVKYGDPASEVKVEVFAEAGNAISIQVTNKAHRSRIGILERELRRNRSKTPQEAFARALERLQHLPEGSTMLGLARVALEATLDVRMTDDLVVCTARIDTGLSRSTHNINKNSGAAAEGPESAPVESRKNLVLGPPTADPRDVEASTSTSLTRRIDGLPMRSGDSSQSVPAVAGSDKKRGRH